VTSHSPHRIFVGKDTHKFSCAHMTIFPDGTKERLHGHNFSVSIAMDLARVQPMLDFAVLKQALQRECDDWTEHLLLPGKSEYFRVLSREGGELEFSLCGKRYVVPSEDALVLPVENIVVESLAIVFAERLITRLEPHLDRAVATGLEVTVTESPGQGGSHYVRLD
jgi:6-pyruvoyltetrahydropterin/6-carboxytetrahydropterin synthase